MRGQLKEIEKESYNLSLDMVTHVRENYERIIKRKDQEILTLKKKIDTKQKKEYKYNYYENIYITAKLVTIVSVIGGRYLPVS